MTERYRWTCPGCARTFKVPEGQEPTLCPECETEAQAKKKGIVAAEAASDQARSTRKCKACGKPVTLWSVDLISGLCAECRRQDSSGYTPFEMCPFTQVSVGGGATIGGIGGERYVWTHGRCIGQYCRLYTYKFDENGEVYAEGCNLQFLGLSADEIRLNQEFKRNAIQNDRG